MLSDLLFVTQAIYYPSYIFNIWLIYFYIFIPSVHNPHAKAAYILSGVETNVLYPVECNRPVTNINVFLSP